MTLLLCGTNIRFTFKLLLLHVFVIIVLLTAACLGQDTFEKDFKSQFVLKVSNDCNSHGFRFALTKYILDIQVYLAISS